MPIRRSRRGGGKTHLGLSEAQPPFAHQGLKRAECRERVDGGGVVSRFKEQAAEIEACNGEVAVEFQGPLVGMGGLGDIALAMVREAEVVPSLGGAGHDPHGFFERDDRFGGLVFAEKAFTFEQRRRSGRHAAGRDAHGNHADREESGETVEITGGLHRAGWLTPDPGGVKERT